MAAAVHSVPVEGLLPVSSIPLNNNFSFDIQPHDKRLHLVIYDNGGGIKRRRLQIPAHRPPVRCPQQLTQHAAPATKSLFARPSPVYAPGGISQITAAIISTPTTNTRVTDIFETLLLRNGEKIKQRQSEARVQLGRNNVIAS